MYTSGASWSGFSLAAVVLLVHVSLSFVMEVTENGMSQTPMALAGAKLTVSAASFPYAAAAYALQLQAKLVVDTSTTGPTLEIQGRIYQGTEDELIDTLASTKDSEAGSTKVCKCCYKSDIYSY